MTHRETAYVRGQLQRITKTLQTRGILMLNMALLAWGVFVANATMVIAKFNKRAESGRMCPIFREDHHGFKLVNICENLHVFGVCGNIL